MFTAPSGFEGGVGSEILSWQGKGSSGFIPTTRIANDARRSQVIHTMTQVMITTKTIMTRLNAQELAVKQVKHNHYFR